MRAKRVRVERQVNFPDVEWMKQYLETYFTHADYLRLNRKWKLIRIERIAKDIVSMAKGN